MHQAGCNSETIAAQRVSAMRAFEALGSCIPGQGVVLGSGFTAQKSSFSAFAISHMAIALDAVSLAGHLNSAPESPTLLCLPYDIGLWYEHTAHATRVPTSQAPSDPMFELPVVLTLRPAAESATRSSPLSHTVSWESPTHRDREQYERRVERAVEYIRAGDVFQVNISHSIRGVLEGCPRSLGAALAYALSPNFFAYAELSQDRVVISCSPELFIKGTHIRGTTELQSEPIKGTRAATESANEALLQAEKDQAELAMIVDLMRNDLGRVSSSGSVRVTDSRRVESHHGNSVLHAIGTVRAALRDGLEYSDVLSAAFPPGSVTGAPKVRAMQIVDELEQAPRGWYCGSMALIEQLSMRSSVLIRTLVLERLGPDRWSMSLKVGAGIVADSVPHEEWDETLVKAQPVLSASRNAIS